MYRTNTVAVRTQYEPCVGQAKYMATTIETKTWLVVVMLNGISSAPRQRSHCPGVSEIFWYSADLSWSSMMLSTVEMVWSVKHAPVGTVSVESKNAKLGSCGGHGGGSIPRVKQRASREPDTVRMGLFILGSWISSLAAVLDVVECTADALLWRRNAPRSNSAGQGFLALLWYCRSRSLESPCFLSTLDRFIGEMYNCGMPLHGFGVCPYCLVSWWQSHVQCWHLR
jgi:hypothetical protein